MTMKMTKVVAAFFVVGMACNPTLAWSQPVDVFPSFGADKEVAVVSEKSDDFRGGMQCTDFVYGISGLAPKGMGNATDWDNTAKKRGYTVSKTPTNKSIGVIEKWSDNPDNGKYGHVYWVTTAKKSGSDYNMDIRHANWEIKEKESKYRDAVYKSSTNKVAIHKGTWRSSGGFITKWK